MFGKVPVGWSAGNPYAKFGAADDTASATATGRSRKIVAAEGGSMARAPLQWERVIDASVRIGASMRNPLLHPSPTRNLPSALGLRIAQDQQDLQHKLVQRHRGQRLRCNQSLPVGESWLSAIEKSVQNRSLGCQEPLVTNIHSTGNFVCHVQDIFLRTFSNSNNKSQDEGGNRDEDIDRLV